MVLDGGANPLRILVLTRSYPDDGDLYQYPFVHRRILAYRAAGHEVTVFRQGQSERATSHIFDGVECLTGGAAALEAIVARHRPQVIAAHGFCETMWPMLSGIAGKVPIRAWLHGSEIPAFFRQKAECIADPQARADALACVAERRRFWTDFLSAIPDDFGLVLVSNSAVDLMREDVGNLLADRNLAVIPNPIDTDLFAYRRKVPEDRFSVLSIRPFDSPTYANDLSVDAIRILSGREGFERMRFTIIGDGPLFDETLAPLRGLANVAIQRRFLDQRQIAREHATHGMFLVPTRLDTHGVSRDEAMASGLVPVTNAVSAVPEFVDDSCAALAPPDDAEGLADALWTMVEQPQLFLARSLAAAARVQLQSGHDRVIPAELALLRDAANG
jgi:glycosyltransferase involved in cell wall biosynthesis